MDLIKCFAVVFLIDSVNSIKDVKLNNLKLETVSKLLNILSKYQNNIKYIHVQPNLNDDFSHNKNDIDVLNDVETEKRFVHPKYNKNKTWIKRLVPHGLPPSNLEFDAKYKTIYRPLVRIHKRKRLPNIQVMLNVNGNNDDVDKYGIDVHDYFDNDEDVISFVKKNEPEEILKNVQEIKDIDEDLLQPFAYHLTGSKTLKEIEQILKRFRSRPSTSYRIDKIAKILNEIQSLRTPEKSGEDNTQHTHHAFEHRHKGEPVNKPEKPSQHYPPWNYWTYKKTIHQDQCPKGQVRINDRCIWLPPH